MTKQSNQDNQFDYQERRSTTFQKWMSKYGVCLLILISTMFIGIILMLNYASENRIMDNNIDLDGDMALVRHNQERILQEIRDFQHQYRSDLAEIHQKLTMFEDSIKIRREFSQLHQADTRELRIDFHQLAQSLIQIERSLPNSHRHQGGE